MMSMCISTGDDTHHVPDTLVLSTRISMPCIVLRVALLCIVVYIGVWYYQAYAYTYQLLCITS